MFEILEKLCTLDGASGDEKTVRDFIISEIKDFCEYKIDALGNIIAFKKGEKESLNKLMIDAHMDEVGLIITSITESGMLKFKTVGGIETPALMTRRVTLNANIKGVIGGKPIHLMKDAERKKLPDKDSLYIDIGAETKQEAEKYITVGDFAVIDGEYIRIGNKILSKALDDRIGCAALIKLIKEEKEYSFYATFTVQEELGCRGAKTATFGVNPQFAIALEATTAADIADVSEENAVCKQGNGPAVSFMDRATLYDKKLYNTALESPVKCQPKMAVAGGNNASAIHLSREGVRTLAVSVPTRYIHSCSSVADIEDIKNTYELCRYMIKKICGGEAND